MRKINIFLQIIIYFSLFLSAFFTLAFATSIPPDFPSCVNPQGSIIANYSSGTHGVPGIVTSFQGTDTVYAVTKEAIVQCLCPVNGEGVQTNWWKIPALSREEIESFKSQGWVFVPDGLVWGLNPTAFLARNANFSCGGVSAAVTSVGDVLGLAATGNIVTIYGLFFTGLLSLMVGYLLNRRNS